MTQITQQPTPPPNLLPGPVWTSFDRLKMTGSTALEAVRDGVIGKLQTKSGQYVILTEADFQTLYGLAQEMHRLQEGLSVVISAARAVQVHRDQPTVDTLLRAVAVFGLSPVLPTRTRPELSDPPEENVEDLLRDL